MSTDRPIDPATTSDDRVDGRPDTISDSDHGTAGSEPTTTGRSPRPPLLPGWQGDLGLLAMRLVLAASFIGHGSQKVFGAFDGTGIQGFADGTLRGYGFEHTTLLAWVTGLTELGGGVLVLLGLFTPLAATGLMAVMINTVILKFHDGFFFQDNGFEIDLLLLGLAGGLVLTGPGRVSLDAGGLLRRLLSLRLLFLAVGIAAGLAFYFLLRG